MQFLISTIILILTVKFNVIFQLHKKKFKINYIELINSLIITIVFYTWQSYSSCFNLCKNKNTIITLLMEFNYKDVNTFFMKQTKPLLEYVL